jgi:hypothetical protein
MEKENKENKGTVDIISLMEVNPIINLNKTYNNVLIEKIKNKFRDEHQKLFIVSFYCYINYNSNDFIIDIDNVWDWLGFSKKTNATKFLVANFKENIDYKIYNEKDKSVVFFDAPNGAAKNKQGKNDNRGGHNNKKIFVTIRAFKKMCLKANTAKSEMLHEYYLNLEEIVQETLKEQSEEFKKQLEDITIISEKEKEELEKRHKLEIKYKKEIERHEVLRKYYRNRNTVYVAKIKEYGDRENVSVLLKIGETHDTDGRVNELNNDFQTKVILLEVYPCNDSVRFETAILNYMKKYQYKYPQKNKSDSTETFLVNKKIYKKLIKYIETNIKEYDTFTYAEITENYKNSIEMKKLELEQERIQLEKIKQENDNVLALQELKLKQMILEKDKKILEVENNKFLNEKEISFDPLYVAPNKKIAKGSKIQKYTKECPHKLLCTYKSLSDAVVSVNDENSSDSIVDDISKGPLKLAAKNNTIYKGYRWFEIPQDEDDNIEHQIPETVEIREVKYDFVVMLDIHQKEIIKIFAEQKDAVIDRKLKSRGSITNAIQKGTICSGHYWKRFSECEQSLIDDYLKKGNKLPEARSIGKKIYQINPKTKRYIEYSTIEEVVLKFKFGRNTLNKYINSRDPLRGFLWSYEKPQETLSEYPQETLSEYPQETLSEIS